jgi:hypothetical protein
MEKIKRINKEVKKKDNPHYWKSDGCHLSFKWNKEYNYLELTRIIFTK